MGCVGPLPPTLANLTDLRLLDISNNGLGGPLPAAYGSNDAWRLLQRLNLSHNRLTGVGTAPVLTNSHVDKAF